MQIKFNIFAPNQWKQTILFFKIKIFSIELTPISILYFVSSYNILEKSWMRKNLGVMVCLLYFIIAVHLHTALKIVMPQYIK